MDDPAEAAAARASAAALARDAGSGFPSVAPTLRERTSALFGRIGPLLWLYALVPVPILTDWIENRALPASPVGWLTEVCGGLVIMALVWRVRRDRHALEALARSDGLTGLLNRRSFETSLAAEFTRARRTRQPLCVVYLDIDRFKAVNDRFGHGAGDQVLRQLTAGIRATVRARVDAGFRLGGDEFALLLPSTTKDQAEAIVARLRSFCAVNDPRWAVGAFDFSAGIVELEADDTAAGLMTRVDAAMYREKNTRRAA